jgi:hypothetical protein
MAEDDLGPDGLAAKASRDTEAEQKDLLNAIEKWIGFESRRRLDGHSEARDRESWLATADYLFAMANMLGKSPVPFAGDPVRMAAVGIIEALTGHAPKAFNPPRKRGRQPHGPTQVIAKAVAVTYIHLSKKKSGRFIPDPHSTDTVCDAFKISVETLAGWEDDVNVQASIKAGVQRWNSLLSSIDDPAERLTVARLFLKAARTAWQQGL